MKPVNRIMLAFGAVAFAFASCEELVEREIAPKETSGVYFLETNVTSHTFLPDATVAFDVLVGRVNADKQETVKYEIEDEYGVFVLPDSIVFEKGVTVDTIHVTAPDMLLGMNAELILTINDPENVSIYGAASVTISVLRDYEWINRGTATYTDAVYGFGTSSCGIYQAKGTTLFKLVDPYKGLEAVLQDAGMGSDWTMPTGYSLQFTMDTVNWQISGVAEGAQDIGLLEFSNYIFYYDSRYAAYGIGYSSAGNNYTITAFLWNLSDDGLYGPVPFSFVWDEANFPGELIDPEEGEGNIELSIAMTNCDAQWWGDLNITDKYGNSLFSNYYLVLSDANYNYVVLDLYANPGESIESFVGEYTIDDSNNAGTVLAGYNDANGKMGSYVLYQSTKTTLYLSEGKVIISEEGGQTTIAVDAKSISGAQIKATWTGELNVEDMVNTNGGETMNVSLLHTKKHPQLRFVKLLER